LENVLNEKASIKMDCRWIIIHHYRFLLRMGEDDTFPGAAKTVYDWFDPKERGLANGIAIGGAAIGVVIAPPLTVWIAPYFGWRGGFVIPGLMGLVWVGVGCT